MTVIFYILILIFQIVDEVSHLCDLIPQEQLLHDQCQAYIGIFLDDIWELLVDRYLKPNEICTILGPCSINQLN